MSEQKICKFEGCNRVAHARGYCTQHYSRMAYYGEFSNGEICKVHGCDRPVFRKELCAKHYNYVNKKIEKNLDVSTHQLRFDELIKELEQPKIKPTICKVEGCDGLIYRTGLCMKHYYIHKKEIKHKIETNYDDTRSLYETLLSNRQDNKCIIPNCENKCWRDHVFCPEHYALLKNFIDTKLIDYRIKQLIQNDNNE